MNAQDDHPVVGQHVGFDCLFERQALQLGAIDVQVAHVDGLDSTSSKRCLGRGCVDPGSSRHVEPLAGSQAVVVVDQLEATVPQASCSVGNGPGCAVRLVAENEIECTGCVLALGIAEAMQ